jgi:hypothetical protein
MTPNVHDLSGCGADIILVSLARILSHARGEGEPRVGPRAERLGAACFIRFRDAPPHAGKSRSSR